MLERNPNCVAEFVDILALVLRQRDGQTALELVDLLTDTPFVIHAFKRCIKSLANCKDTPSKSLSEIMKNDRFRTLLVKGDTVKNSSHGTICVKDVTRVLPKKFAFRG